MLRALLWSYRIAAVAFSVATLFGLPSPLRGIAAMDALRTIDLWMFQYAAYPSLFALSVGLVTGTIILPSVWRLLHPQLVGASLKCSFDAEDAACVFAAPFTGTDVWGKFFCVRVDVTRSRSVPHCSAKLVGVTSPSGRFLRGDITIPFAPREFPDSSAKTIQKGLPEYINVIHVTTRAVNGTLRENIDFLTPSGTLPNAFVPSEIFREKGKYTLKVIAFSPAAENGEIDLEFNWTGDSTTTAMVQSPSGKRKLKLARGLSVFRFGQKEKQAALR